ncbi:MAG TPA: hypothetical protein VH107_14795 [Lacipirellulaceae bacterium]|jgi:hypothetical protein|nr:hypothetical protein [Lacipirellulaceae bacterium]
MLNLNSNSKFLTWSSLMKSTVFVCVSLAASLINSLTSLAATTVPFTENFTSSVSNWADATGGALATFVPSGGPDGSSYATSTFNVSGSADDDGIIVFRAQDEFNSSNHAFEGNWLAGGINHFSAYVLNTSPVPIQFFARFSTASNFPGVAADNITIAQPNAWTLLSFDINPSAINVTLFPEGVSSLYNSVFTNVGHVQIGFDVPAGYGGMNSTLTFGLDKVAINTPEPTTEVLALGGLGFGFFRRRSRTA